MTGPEHYREAERLAEAYKQAHRDVEQLPANNADQRLIRMHAQADANALLSKAQVHATLAVAAATAEPIAKSYDGDDFREYAKAWSEAIS